MDKTIYTKVDNLDDDKIRFAVKNIPSLHVISKFLNISYKTISEREKLKKRIKELFPHYDFEINKNAKKISTETIKPALATSYNLSAIDRKIKARRGTASDSKVIRKLNKKIKYNKVDNFTEEEILWVYKFHNCYSLKCLAAFLGVNYRYSRERDKLRKKLAKSL